MNYRQAVLFMPGVLICSIVAAASRFLSDHYSAPTMLFALLIGLSLHFLVDDQKVAPGIRFAAADLLKLGVALLGLRITLADIGDLGVQTIGLVIGGVIFSISIGIAITLLLGKNIRFGVLSGGAVGICGASAALAISAVLPTSDTRERDTAFIVVAVTTLSTVAMVLYPILGKRLGLDDQHIGILLGLTIHDVAQVVGAGFSVSEETGNIATLIKLFRVSMLVPVIIVISFAFRKQNAQCNRSGVPWFVHGFAIAIVINSLGVLPETIRVLLAAVSSWMLVIGIVGIGIKTSLKSLGHVGGAALVIVCLETLLLFAVAAVILVL
ncbi:MAG: putative sulfate exporter family transporter [Pacificibacter sp.]|uniref:YeiH family protein n=1 Tax=Pacificibacter sp. TaxID=1917866 RepID=UPI00321A8611